MHWAAVYIPDEEGFAISQRGRIRFTRTGDRATVPARGDYLCEDEKR